MFSILNKLTLFDDPLILQNIVVNYMLNKYCNCSKTCIFGHRGCLYEDLYPGNCFIGKNKICYHSFELRVAMSFKLH